MTTNNLYSQLIQLAHNQNIEVSECSSARESNKQLDEFTIKMNEIKKQIEKIKQNNESIMRVRNKLTTNALPNKQSQYFQEIRRLSDQNYQQIKIIKDNLTGIADVVKKEMAEHPEEPETYSKLYHRQYLVSQVQYIIRETRKVQQLIQKYSINTSMKRIMALDPNMDQDQALEIAKKKDGFEQLVMAKTLGKASLKLKYRVNDILSKHQEILKLEKSVEENLKLMNQVAFLVQQQGQMIDNIYQNIIKAKDYIEKGEKILKKQKKAHKKSRGKMCCIILIGLVILGIIVTPIVLTIVNKNRQK